MDKHGTSAWVSAVGVLLIAFALATRVSDWAHLRSGEFVAVLVLGLIFVLVGVSYGMYARVAADPALRGSVTKGLAHAEAPEDAAAGERQGAAETVKQMADAAPKG